MTVVASTAVNEFARAAAVFEPARLSSYLHLALIASLVSLKSHTLVLNGALLSRITAIVVVLLFPG